MIDSQSEFDERREQKRPKSNRPSTPRTSRTTKNDSTRPSTHSGFPIRENWPTNPSIHSRSVSRDVSPAKTPNDLANPKTSIDNKTTQSLQALTNDPKGENNGDRSAKNNGTPITRDNERASQVTANDQPLVDIAQLAVATRPIPPAVDDLLK